MKRSRTVTKRQTAATTRGGTPTKRQQVVKKAPGSATKQAGTSTKRPTTSTRRDKAGKQLPKMVQDDKRERQMRKLCGLTKPGRSRSGTDAVLRIKGRVFEFELKSTTQNSLTTARDLSLKHIKNWRGKHWLLGFYTNQQRLRYILYASPETMKKWLDHIEEYIARDFTIGEAVPRAVDKRVLRRLLDELCGKKRFYTSADARRILKKQFTEEKYPQSVKGRYNRTEMLTMIRDRCDYLLRRGAAPNCPHILKKYWGHLPRITRDHATRLRQHMSAAGYPKPPDTR